MSKENKPPSLLNGAFLVCGTTIGAGMLAQPVASSTIGLLPATLMMAIAWAFMTITALLILQSCLWLKKETHIISMADHYLGINGKIIAWICYLFIAYGSLTAYVSGGANLFANLFSDLLPFYVPEFIWCVIFAVVFGFAIELGHKTVGKLNTILFISLIVSYIAIIILGSKNINLDNLKIAHWDRSFLIIPLLLTSFSFQMIVPSLANYLERDEIKLKKSIVLGTTFSFIIYFLWNTTVLGSAEVGSDNLFSLAYAEGKLPVHILAKDSKYFLLLINLFSFFAIVTSFIGIAWGLFDFLSDGLKIKKTPKHRFSLWLLVIVPPIFFGATYPNAFIGALESTGGFGDSILNGLIPVGMVYVGVYIFKQKFNHLSFLSAKPILAIISIFAFFVIMLETFNKAGLLTLID